MIIAMLVWADVCELPVGSKLRTEYYVQEGEIPFVSDCTLAYRRIKREIEARERAKKERKEQEQEHEKDTTDTRHVCVS